MHVKVTVIVESVDNELIVATLPTKIDTADLKYPLVKWVWGFITRNKLAAAKHKLHVYTVTSVMKNPKGRVFVEDTKINRRTKPREAFYKALKWFENNCAKLKLTQACLLMCTKTRDIKIYIQEDKNYVESN